MLVDSFMFYNELDILELRLEILDRYVDRFILVEAEVNHVGGSKELFYSKNKNRFAKWNHKIEHVVVAAAESPTDPDPWSREKYQRSCILRGLTDVPPDAIVMISDVDEIPDMSKVPFENMPHPMVTCHMWMFEYSLDYLFTGEPWFGTVITTVSLLKSHGSNAFRDSRWNFPKLAHAGWHLSSFGSPMHVWTKLQTYAHGKDPERNLETPELFEKYISEGMHIDGHTKLIPRPIEVPLPGSVEVLRRLRLGTFA